MIHQIILSIKWCCTRENMRQTSWLLTVFVPFWFTLPWIQTVSFIVVLVWHGEACCESGGIECCHQAGRVLLVFRVNVLFIPSQELVSQGSRKQHQADVVKPSHLPGELTWAAEPLAVCWSLGCCEWLLSSTLLTPSLPLALYVPAHPLSNDSLKMPLGQAAQAGSTHKDTPRLLRVPVIPLVFPPHVSVPWCSMLKAPAQANKPVPGGGCW